MCPVMQHAHQSFWMLWWRKQAELMLLVSGHSKQLLLILQLPVGVHAAAA